MANGFWDGLSGIFSGMGEGISKLFSGGAESAGSAMSGGGGGLLMAALAAVGGIGAWAMGFGPIAVGIGIFLGGLLGGVVGEGVAPSAHSKAQRILRDTNNAPIKSTSAAHEKGAKLNIATRQILANAMEHNTPIESQVDTPEVKARSILTDQVYSTILAAELREGSETGRMHQYKKEIIQRYKKYIQPEEYLEAEGQQTDLTKRELSDLLDTAEKELTQRITRKHNEIKETNSGWTNWLAKKLPKANGVTRQIHYAVDVYLPDYLENKNPNAYVTWDKQATYLDGMLNSMNNAGTFNQIGESALNFTTAFAFGARKDRREGMGNAIREQLEELSELHILIKDYHELLEKRTEILESATREVQQVSPNANVTQRSPTQAPSPDQQLYATNKAEYLRRFMYDNNFGDKGANGRFKDADSEFIQRTYQRYVEGTLHEQPYLDFVASKFKLTEEQKTALKSEASDENLLRKIAEVSGITYEGKPLISFLDSGELEALKQLKKPAATRTAMNDAKAIGQQLVSLNVGNHDASAIPVARHNPEKSPTVPGLTA